MKLDLSSFLPKLRHSRMRLSLVECTIWACREPLASFGRVWFYRPVSACFQPFSLVCSQETEPDVAANSSTGHMQPERVETCLQTAKTSCWLRSRCGPPDYPITSYPAASGCCFQEPPWITELRPSSRKISEGKPEDIFSIKKWTTFTEIAVLCDMVMTVGLQLQVVLRTM